MEIPLLLSSLHWLLLSVVVAVLSSGDNEGPCFRFHAFSGHSRSFVCPITDAGLGSIPPNSSALRLVPTDAGQSKGLNLTIPSLPSLRTLEVDVTRQGTLSSSPFARLSRLTQLQLFHSSAASADAFRFVLVAGYLDGIPDLRRLFLPDLGIDDLPPGAFRGLGNLRMLELHLNRLWRIRNGTFSEDCCRLLSRLTLSMNRIADLRLVSLSGLSGLQSLDLSFNRLSSLPGRSFDGLSSLVNLNLERNAIHSIHPSAFAGLANLRELTLNYNRLQGLTSGDVIGISRSSFDGLTSLETLELKANGISRIDFGDELSRLRYLTRLDLSENRISFLSVELFEDLSNLTDLDLRDNRLTTLDERFLWIFNRMSSLDLSLNPWRCDCQLLWLTEWLRRTSDASSSSARRERRHVVMSGLDDTRCSDPGAAGVGGVTLALSNYTAEHEECKDRLTSIDSLQWQDSTQTTGQPQTTSGNNRHSTDTHRDNSKPTATQTTDYVTNAIMTSSSTTEMTSSSTTEMASPSTEMTTLSAEIASFSVEVTSLSAEMTSSSPVTAHDETIGTQDDSQTTEVGAEMEKPTRTVEETPTVESVARNNSTVLRLLLPLTTPDEPDAPLTSTSEADDRRTSDAAATASPVVPKHLRGDAATITISSSSSLFTLILFFFVYESLR